MSEGPDPEPRAAAGSGGPGDEPVRYSSFGDYVRVVRRRKWLVLAITVLVTVASVLLSLSRPTVYEASSQLSFRDLLADLNLIGVGDAVPEQGPAQLAQINADTIDRPEVTKRVQRRMEPRLTTEELENAVTGAVGVQTNLVSVNAQWGEAERAAEIANEYARAAMEAGVADQRRRLNEAEKALERELGEAREVSKDAPDRGIRISVLEQTLSRVQFLEQVAEPVRIVERAEVPSGPTSPQPVRDGILGGMVGLVLGLLAAFGRESLDRRLHTARELHDELGMPVLGRVPVGAFRAAGLVPNGKGPITEADFEAFRVLRMNLAALDPESPPRTLLVTSAMPEEGKTTVAVSLACASAVAGHSTLLIECDLRRPSFAKRLGIDRAPGLADYLLEQASPQDVLRTVQLAPPAGQNGKPPTAAPQSNLVCIPAGSAVSNPAELLIGERFRELLAEVRGVYDLVVIDSGPLLSVVDPLELVPQVDAVLFCARAQRTTRDQLRAGRAALANVPRRPAGAVLTGLKRRGPESYDYYYGY